MPERVSRAEIERWWNDGWATAFAALDALTPADLGRTVTIRGEAFLVTEALNRSVTHAAYHVGQMVYLARHFAGAAWQSLSIPKGESAKFARGEFKQGIIERLANAESKKSRSLKYKVCLARPASANEQRPAMTADFRLQPSDFRLCVSPWLSRRTTLRSSTSVRRSRYRPRRSIRTSPRRHARPWH